MRNIPKLGAVAAGTLALGLSQAASALPINVFKSPDLTTSVGTIGTIDTSQTGEEHYNYFSASGHPSGVNLAPFKSNIWVHHDDRTADSYSFGFIFSEEGTSGDGSGNSADFAFRIVNSDTSVFVSQSDDPEEATETAPGAFSGTFNYNDENTDGIMVSGITGTDWTIIIDSVDFGEVDEWVAANGNAGESDLSLTLNSEYRLTPLDVPSGANVDPDLPPIDASEPGTLGLLGAGLVGLWFMRRRRSV